MQKRFSSVILSIDMENFLLFRKQVLIHKFKGGSNKCGKDPVW